MLAINTKMGELQTQRTVEQFKGKEFEVFSAGFERKVMNHTFLSMQESRPSQSYKIKSKSYW